MKLVRYCFVVTLSLFCCAGMLQTQTLSAGDIVIVAMNGDADATYSYGRGFSFMPLVHLNAGTIINFTDYGWSDSTGAFITNTGTADAFIHYTVPTGGITAGTIIRCDSYNNTNFTFDYSYSGSGQNYLNVAGLTQGDEVLVFQGTRTAPTFIFAASLVSTTIVSNSWATNVGTNGTDGTGSGSALPGTGNASVADLVDDVTALSFNQPAAANDNCAYSGATTATTMAGWKARVATYANWTFNDAAPIPTPPVGPFTVTDATPVEKISGTEFPRVFNLGQNYPNPFNPTTTISFTLTQDGFTTLKIYDILGREVATLVNDEIKAGTMHTATFSGSNLASGIYFSRLESSGNVQMKKLVLMK